MALFCTDTFLAAHGDALADVAPGLEVVALHGGDRVVPAEVERITMAFFSHDAFPERAAAFMRVALDAPNLRWFHSMAAGVDNPVFGRFVERGVRLTTSSGASAPPIAATCITYLLALSRDLPRLGRAQAAHEWAPARFTELRGRRVVVAGYGPIGQEVVRLATAFGMEPVVLRRAAQGDEPCPAHSLDEIVDVVADAAALVVALPLTERTRGLVSREVLAAMDPDAFVVNVGRGELIDQQALTEALSLGRLGGAGLDVFVEEPLPADDPLWDLPNVIITPHMAGSTSATGRRVVEIFFDNLGRFRRGEPLRNEVERPQQTART